MFLGTFLNLISLIEMGQAWSFKLNCLVKQFLDYTLSFRLLFSEIMPITILTTDTVHTFSELVVPAQHILYHSIYISLWWFYKMVLLNFLNDLVCGMQFLFILYQPFDKLNTCFMWQSASFVLRWNYLKLRHLLILHLTVF